MKLLIRKVCTSMPFTKSNHNKLENMLLSSGTFLTVLSQMQLKPFPIKCIVYRCNRKLTVSVSMELILVVNLLEYIFPRNIKRCVFIKSREVFIFQHKFLMSSNIFALYNIKIFFL